MRQQRWATWMAGSAVGCALLSLCGVGPTTADIRSDQPAAILEWPLVFVLGSPELNSTSGGLINTVIQLSNTSTDAVFAHCFYENANFHCTNTGEVCLGGVGSGDECCDIETGCGICAPGWNETDFHVQITPRQPLGWLASDGVADFDYTPPKYFGTFAIDGVHNTGIGGSSNAGSRIPPVPEEPFIGSLRCIAVDADGIPVDRNVLKGESTLTLFESRRDDAEAAGITPIFDGDIISVAKSNAIGIQAIEGAVNDDNILVLGGPEPEYNGCPSFLILNHFFDGAQNPAVERGMMIPSSESSTIITLLTLVPCSENYLRQIPGSAVVQYLVYNEFEQRFSTSRSMECQQFLPLSNIDTTQNERSIFSAGVSGTLTGQTRLNPLGSGLLAIALEIHGVGVTPPIDEFNVHYQGDRVDPDLIVLP